MRARLATINLQVADPERSKRFYVDVLGMAEDAGRSHPPAFVYLRSDGCDVTLAVPQGSGGAQPSHTIVAAASSAVRNRLRHRGQRSADAICGWMFTRPARATD